MCFRSSKELFYYRHFTGFSFCSLFLSVRTDIHKGQLNAYQIFKNVNWQLLWARKLFIIDDGEVELKVLGCRLTY